MLVKTPIRQRAESLCEMMSGTCVAVHDPDRPTCTPENCAVIRFVEELTTGKVIATIEER